MDCAEVKGQIPAEEQLEPLVILEEGDELDDFTQSFARGKGMLRVKKDDMEDIIKGSGTDSKNDVEEGESAHMTITQEQEGLEYDSQKREGVTEAEENSEEKRVQTGPRSVTEKPGGETEGSKTDSVPEEDPVAETQPSAKLRPKDRLRPEDAQQKVMFYEKLIMYSELPLKEQFDISGACCHTYKQLLLQSKPCQAFLLLMDSTPSPRRKSCELLCSS